MIEPEWLESKKQGRSEKSRPLYLDRRGQPISSGMIVRFYDGERAIPAILFHNKRQDHWRIEDINRGWREAKVEHIAEANLYYFPEIERR